MSEKPEQSTFNKSWLILAVIGFVAAFLFQWGNSIQQGSIAQTDSGEVVRIQFEDGYFKISSSGNTPFAEALICDENGKVLGRLLRKAEGDQTFELDRDAEQAAAFPQEKYLRVVIPSLRSEGKPLVLLVENPFR